MLESGYEKKVHKILSAYRRTLHFIFRVPDMWLKQNDELSAFGCLSLSVLTSVGKF